MAEEVVKTIENVDKLFSEIVVNGEVHKSNRYTSPSAQSASPSSVRSTQGEDVHAVELNEVLHNFSDPDVISDVQTLQQGLANEVSERTTTDQALDSAITQEANARSSADGVLQTNIDTVSGDVSTLQGSVSTLQGKVSTIESKIPSQASSSNQLADKNFVNSSVSTNTANFIGTFESVTDLEAYAGTVTNNDYAFVRNTVVQYNGGDFPNVTALNSYDKTTLTNGDYAWVVNSEDNTKYDLYRFDIVEQSWVLRNAKIDKSQDVLNSFFNRYKATVSGSTVTWAYEYTLNNSSFTAQQWATINSGLTSTSVSDAINALDVASAGGAGKFIQAISEADGKINATEGTVDTSVTQNSTNPVTAGAVYTHVDSKVTQAITQVLNTSF